METRSRKQALVEGLVKYFTGVACKRGHVAERYSVDGKCTMCKAEYEYSEGYRVKRIERDARRYNTDPRLFRERAAAYKASHRDEEKEWRRRYYEKNRDRLLADAKSYQARTYNEKKIKHRLVQWTDISEIARIHQKCEELNRVLPNTHFRVSYIIPLAGRIVCGLHTADNLRIVSETFDLSSANRFTREEQEIESARYLKWLRDRE